MATSLVFVATFGRETLVFDDEPGSRHHFSVRYDHFWRRDLYSSPFFGGKSMFLATRSVLVTILRRETLFFGDKPRFRRHFWLRNACFWRRDSISSPFLSEKRSFLAMSLVFVTTFG
ncbi:hypothetical protein LI012_07790 [Caldibacillus thermoamylovorans]|uniref:hypothetical protein n=1 Tax=Caldibacillus thermoamylovorans TaxID=35841 RepID=UPI001D086692|nr:hypothetical protein [Caldibacillus thermoamylovorans]MCB5935740.1 hypothetical protein [Bacillus sp. DFI.2.34]MCB7076726.1 hypothetical protein [Caldibacillus thermoamylovorans]